MQRKGGHDGNDSQVRNSKVMLLGTILPSKQTLSDRYDTNNIVAPKI